MHGKSIFARGAPMAQPAAAPDRISEAAIGRLVDAFYVKVRADPQLGPVFERAIAPDEWDAHLATMRNFWSSVMLTSGRYKGNPVPVHQQVEGIELRLFDRWLALFGQTCGELFDEPVAATFRDRAHRIAESLKLAVFYRPDRPWPQQAAEGTP
jgi:hemoglobin